MAQYRLPMFTLGNEPAFQKGKILRQKKILNFPICIQKVLWSRKFQNTQGFNVKGYWDIEIFDSENVERVKNVDFVDSIWYAEMMSCCLLTP